MTTIYNPEEVERLIETVRRIANIERPPCPDCSCWSCADCHCSLEHARRDREIAMSDQLEAARVRIAELESKPDWDEYLRIRREADAAASAIERMEPVVAAAKRWRDYGPAFAGLAAAVDEYRAKLRGLAGSGGKRPVVADPDK